MKPIPAPSNPEESSTDSQPSSASKLLRPAGFSSSNRRTPQAQTNKAYPLLLLLSTAVAIFFGLMYINKPMVTAGKDAEDTESSSHDSATHKDDSKTGLLPNQDALPGDGGKQNGKPNGGSSAINTAPTHSRFEETNMRVQHILTARSDDGHVSRIDLEVPVLYESRRLRWTPSEVAQAEALMIELMDYQDKSRQLKAQGELLLGNWNALIGKSIPASRLRADSPSLPDNQIDGQIKSGPQDTTTRDAVEIQPKDKP